jgi:membrane protein
MFKVLPDAKVEWRDVWFGAVVTALLFAVGKLPIGMYLGGSNLGSTYGAAGSLVLVLFWTYYSSLIFFFGAELTQAWARRSGRRVEPAPGSRIAQTAPLRPHEAD